MQNWLGTLKGGCLCGDVRYEVTGPAIFVAQCCCRDCQKATGTGHTTIFGVKRAQVLLQGTPVTYACRGDSGGDVVRHFCGRCGGRLYTTGQSVDDVVILQAGSLDDPNAVTPESVIYAKDAVKWDRFEPALPKFPAMPPMRS
jgi:hypothetical protein